MKQKMSEKHKLMAYVLSTDADLNRHKNITQSEIANILGVSQSTVAQSIKEVKFRRRIDELEKELSQVKKEVIKLQVVDTLQLPENIDPKYKRKPCLYIAMPGLTFALKIGIIILIKTK